jgi:DNA processing protein
MWLRMWKLWGKITPQFLAFSSLEKTLQYAEKSPKLSQSVLSVEEAQKLYDEAKSFGAEVLTPTHPTYPQSLLEINDFPLVLYAYGNLELFKKPKVAIVGSRSASAEAMQISYNFAKELSQAGFAIVSGFANGIDTSACKGALEHGSIQVLGSGLKVPYPHTNISLFHEVVKKGGLFLSEFPILFPAKPANFPIRNRIITGLSLGVLIGQANRRNGVSGTLVTLRIAINQGKEIFAYPGSILDERHTICNNLIKNGTAYFTTSSEDIITALNSHHKKNTNTQQILEKFEEIIEKPSLFTQKKEEVFDAQLNPVYGTISTSPISINDISSITNLSSSIVQQTLIELELEGKIVVDALGRYTRSLV